MRKRKNIVDFQQTSLLIIKRSLDLLTVSPSFGLRYAVNVLLKEIEICLTHKKNLHKARRYRGKTDLKLNIVCGGNLKKGWINIDFSNEADLSIDLIEKLPFESNSCQEVHSEHFLEHLDYPYPAISFLLEIKRVLKSGGKMRLGVPDAEFSLKAYSDKRLNKYFAIAKEKWHPSYCTTKVEHINYHFRNNLYPNGSFYLNQHRYAYDFDTLKKALKSAGFLRIQKSSFDPKRDSLEWNEKLGTLYVVAKKSLRP